MQGDREALDDRFFATYDAGRCGIALPTLLAEDWRIASVTPVSRTEAEGFGAALIVLERPRRAP